MRANEGNLQEKRLGALIRIQKIYGSLAGPVRGVQMFRKNKWFAAIVVPSESGSVGVGSGQLRPEPGFVVTAFFRSSWAELPALLFVEPIRAMFVKHHLVIAVGISNRVKMILTGDRSIVTRVR